MSLPPGQLPDCNDARKRLLFPPLLNLERSRSSFVPITESRVAAPKISSWRNHCMSYNVCKAGCSFRGRLFSALFSAFALLFGGVLRHRLNSGVATLAQPIL